MTTTTTTTTTTDTNYLGIHDSLLLHLLFIYLFIYYQTNFNNHIQFLELLCCCWKIYTIRGRFANLVERFGHIHWRFSDTHGEMMSLKTYAKYILNVEGKLEGIKKKH